MLRLVLPVLILGLAACGPDPLTCAELTRDADGGMIVCDPLYPPTFENAFDQTFSQTCAEGGCHSGPRPKGGMNLEELEGAYDDLLQTGQDRIIPFEPECSEV